MKYPAEVLVFWPGKPAIACCDEHISFFTGAAILCEVKMFVTFAPEDTKCVACYDVNVLKDLEALLEERMQEIREQLRDATD